MQDMNVDVKKPVTLSDFLPFLSPICDFLLDYFSCIRYTGYWSKFEFKREAFIVTDILHRTWADIDLDAVRQNYQAVCDRLSPDCHCMAVVKADAYGHGAVHVAKELAAAGAPFFGVSNLDEAIQLRKSGISAPILILAYTPPEHAKALAAYDVTQTVLDGGYADRLEQEAAAAAVTVRVHIKLDTGMSRVGFFCQNESAAPIDELVRVCSLPHLQADGIFTHFAIADEKRGDDLTHRQFRRFTDTLDALAARGITFSVRHCCNSAAALRFPEMHLDMVRAGIVLYGAPPSAEMAGFAPLRNAMALRTVISQIKTVPADTAVSYGHAFTCDRPSVLATLPIGYADGLLRLASGSYKVAVNGRTAPIVGRVCMDQCMIDVTDIPDIREGMTVTVFGADGVTVEDYAACCLTIPYESLCDIGKRVPRVYYKNGEQIAVQHDL